MPPLCKPLVKSAVNNVSPGFGTATEHFFSFLNPTAPFHQFLLLPHPPQLGLPQPDTFAVEGCVGASSPLLRKCHGPKCHNEKDDLLSPALLHAWGGGHSLARQQASFHLLCESASGGVPLTLALLDGWRLQIRGGLWVPAALCRD